MGRYRKILVAFDGSDASRNALLQSFRLACDEKCWITVTSVVPAYEGDLDLTGVKDIRAALHKPCEDALAEAQHLADRERALIKTVCEEGEVYERIVDLADAENCDLIIMGKTGSRRIGRVLVGSVTARVIGHTQRDILVVPADAKIGWKKILVATDGSKYSASAAARAVDFAKAYGGSLVALSVVDVPAEFYADAPKAAEKLVADAKGYVEAVKKQAEAAGVGAETMVVEAEADQAVIAAAGDAKADMIIMGSHGRTGLRRLLMGSVTELVIGHAPCPVLVVKS